MKETPAQHNGMKVPSLAVRGFRRGVRFVRALPTLVEEALPHNSLPRLFYRRRFALQKQRTGDCPHGFSLVVTTRNRRQFLAWAAASVIANTREPFELFIMDNATDDGTQALGRRLEHEHPGVVHYVRLRRNYGTNAYALGFLRAKYQYLVDMDDDILALSKGWDTAAVRAFQAIPRLGFLSLNVVQDQYTQGAKPPLTNYTELIYGDTILEKGPAGGWFAITTRAIYNEVGGFVFRPYKPFHLEDGEFMEVLNQKGYLTGILRQKFVYHASGAYWNAAHGYHRSWTEKYRRDYQEFLPRFAGVQVAAVPDARYAQTMLEQVEQANRVCAT